MALTCNHNSYSYRFIPQSSSVLIMLLIPFLQCLQRIGGIFRHAEACRRRRKRERSLDDRFVHELRYCSEAPRLQEYAVSILSMSYPLLPMLLAKYFLSLPVCLSSSFYLFLFSFDISSICTHVVVTLALAREYYPIRGMMYIVVHVLGYTCSSFLRYDTHQ